jgi:hypothetical protein
MTSDPYLPSFPQTLSHLLGCWPMLLSLLYGRELLKDRLCVSVLYECMQACVLWGCGCVLGVGKEHRPLSRVPMFWCCLPGSIPSKPLNLTEPQLSHLQNEAQIHACLSHHVRQTED